MYMELEKEGISARAGQSPDNPALSELCSEVKTKLAHTVRSNSRRHRTLTPGQIVKMLAREFPPDFHQTLLDQMAQEKGFRDIKSLLTPSGQLFLYSIDFMSPGEAEAKVHFEEMKHVLAERIRRDSRVTTTLTPLGALYDLWPELEKVQVCSVLNQMQNQPGYQDLKTVSAGSGELYLYSELHVSGKYAAMLARCAVNDSCETIAHTVREESKIHPRPTNVSIFNSHVFGIPPSSLGHCIVRVLNKPEYADIRKLVHPESEAVYLYSNLYLSEEQASSMMRWLEESRRPKAANADMTP